MRVNARRFYRYYSRLFSYWPAADDAAAAATPSALAARFNSLKSIKYIPTAAHGATPSATTILLQICKLFFSRFHVAVDLAHAFFDSIELLALLA
jgi:hypothetical protein